MLHSSIRIFCVLALLSANTLGQIVTDPLHDHKNTPRLSAGRLNKLHVSWFYKTTLTSRHGLILKAVCNGDNDTGILVASGGRAYFNDDSPQAGGNGRGSFISLSGGPAPVSYDVYVFSMRRATSYAVVSWGNSLTAFMHLLAQDHFGGALVDVGPLRNGDFLEVQSGRPHDEEFETNNPYDTQMALFDADDNNQPLLYNDDRSEDYRDPRITISDNNWTGGRNLALIGKKHRAGASPTGVEIMADLIHGPLNAELLSASFPTTGGAGNQLTLGAGRYYAWVYAATNSPVGHRFPAANPASKMPDDICLSGSEYSRGTLNHPAFKLRAEAFNLHNGWQPLGQTRRIPLAALGTGVGEGWNLFLVEVQLARSTAVRLVTDEETSGTSFFNQWRVMRNPDASELLVATYNILFRDDYHEAKTRNASNLLATRGTVLPGQLRVEERPDQAPWQWEADIIGLQELKKTGDCDLPDDPGSCFAYADDFRDEANLRGPRWWNYVKGRDEEFTWPVGTLGLGPLFVASNVTPAVGSIWFGTAAKQYASCSGPGDYAECQLEGYGGVRPATNFTIPARTAARRYGSSADRPIAAFNLHLEYADKDSHTRLKEIRSLISTIDRLLEKDPDAFNSDRNNPDRRHPKFYQNRIVVLGDFNIHSHICGEHYWIVNELRKHFGYAVDVSQGGDLTGDNHFGMHDHLGVLGADGVPDPYQSYADWRDWPNFTSQSIFPWWATSHRDRDFTTQKNSRDERYDGIILVGKGWAYDDPVRSYMIMSDRDDVSPLNPYGGGVEMWRGANLVTDGGNNYAPNYSLGYGTTAGKPALHSDHLPVGVKLRVFVR
jgi:hypothetical protein